jgi:glycosyltransferase involved in cell wall biosynthesis
MGSRSDRNVAATAGGHPHGVDPGLFSPAQDYLSDASLNLEQAQPSVLFLANVSTRKGIVPLMHAWKQVTAQLPSARLCVAGDGSDLPQMKELAAHLGIEQTVQFTGQVMRSQTPDFYRAHAIYVLPSLGEPYATSLLLEAMSCGRPIVITGAGGSPALVPASGGLRVPVQDAPALAAAMLHLLQHPEDRRIMAAANRLHVLRSKCRRCRRRYQET